MITKEELKNKFRFLARSFDINMKEKNYERAKMDYMKALNVATFLKLDYEMIAWLFGQHPDGTDEEIMQTQKGIFNRDAVHQMELYCIKKGIEVKNLPLQIIRK